MAERSGGAIDRTRGEAPREEGRGISARRRRARVPLGAGLSIAALVAVLLPGLASGRALYAVDSAGLGGGGGGGPATLYRIDPEDGRILRTIGPIGFDHVTGIAFHPITGVLYAVSGANGGTGELLTIDLATGVGTAIGVHGLQIPDLAFAPSGLLYGWSETSDDLVELDLTSGMATTVGSCGVATLRTGLAIDLDGVAYMKEGFAGNLYTVDRLSGACAAPVALGAPGAALHNTLAFDDDGTLHTIHRTGGATDLYTVDPDTGSVALVATIDDPDVSALAFQPPPLEPLYAVDGAGGTAATLYRLDPRNGGVLQTIGPVGFSHVVGLAFHPVTGTLYATSNAGGGGGTQELLTLDLDTGAGTSVGTHTGQIPDVAFAPSGILYGWDELSPTNDDLVTIDLSSGAQTTVGDCVPGTMRSGLSVDVRGEAWMKSGGDLYRVDRATGACTLVTALGGPGGSLDNVLATSARGTHFTVDRTAGVAQLYAIDPVTGDAVFIGTNGITDLAALAFRPHPLPPLYATDGAGNTASTLYRLDPRDGSVLETIGPVGFNEVVGLAFHPVTGELYGVASGGDLLRIDPRTGAGTSVGPHGLSQTPDAAFAPSGTLYSWTENGDDLATVDVATGAGAAVGDCGVGTFQTGLAIDRFGGAWMKAGTTLYPVDRVTGACGTAVALNAGQLHNALAFAPGGILYTLERGVGADLFTVDPQTGDVLPVGSNALANLAALAFKPVRDTSLYAVDGAGSNPSSLYLLDAEDASVVANLGPVGFDHAVGLDFHPVTHQLYALTSLGSSGTQELLTIDPETGAGTAVGGHASETPDMAFAPSGLLYAWAEFGVGSDDLVEIDPASGTATLVGDCGAVTAGTGLAIDSSGEAFMKTTGTLFAVDRVTGACTTISALSGTARNALAFDANDRLYTLDRPGAGAELFTLEIASGALTSVGSNDITTLAALAFRPLQHHPLYAADGAGSNPSTLYRLDPRDGSLLQTIGAIGFDHVTGISFEPGTEVLYGTSSVDLSGTGELLTIDPLSGAGAAVGAHGLRTPDLAFARNGVLYSWVEGPDDLHTLDLGNGTGTLVGNCGVSTFQTGLAVDAAARIWMKSSTELYSVDPGTGACTPEVSLSNSLHNLLEINDRGTFYSAARGPTTLYTLDRQTGDVRMVGGNGITELAAIAFLPEPSFGLALGAGIGLLGLLARRRRRGR